MSSQPWTNEPSTEAQLGRLAALNLLEDRAYTKGEASNLLNEAQQLQKQPDWKLANANPIVESALKKSLQSAIMRLKAEIKRGKLGDDTELLESLAFYQSDLDDCLENERLQKLDEREHKRAVKEDLASIINVVQFDFSSDGAFGDEFRRPTKPQIAACLAELDRRQPDWQTHAFYPDSTIIADLLRERFPELLRSPSALPPKPQQRRAATPVALASVPNWMIAILLLIVCTPACFFWLRTSSDTWLPPLEALHTKGSSKSTTTLASTPHVPIPPAPTPAKLTRTDAKQTMKEHPPANDSLLPMRDWTHRDGRTLEAALVSVAKNAGGLYEGTFRRANGEAFTFVIGNLSDEDVSAIKTEMQKRGLIEP